CAFDLRELRDTLAERVRRSCGAERLRECRGADFCAQRCTVLRRLLRRGRCRECSGRRERHGERDEDHVLLHLEITPGFGCLGVSTIPMPASTRLRPAY